jgi:hypothetical protein
LKQTESFLNRKQLFSITTGKQTSFEAQNDLLDVIGIGLCWKNEFVNGSFTVVTTFEKAIQMRCVQNYASDTFKTKLASKTKKVELRGTRHLFGRLLYLSSVNDIDSISVSQ